MFPKYVILTLAILLCGAHARSAVSAQSPATPSTPVHLTTATRGLVITDRDPKIKARLRAGSSSSSPTLTQSRGSASRRAPSPGLRGEDVIGMLGAMSGGGVVQGGGVRDSTPEDFQRYSKQKEDNLKAIREKETELNKIKSDLSAAAFARAASGSETITQKEKMLQSKKMVLEHQIKLRRESNELLDRNMKSLREQFNLP